jgi:dienelactone hydrolase
MGMAVLIFDRRGSGASSGTLTDVSFETLADDGIAGARAIAREPRIDSAHIGYWGLSQGGWLAVVAAGRDSKAAFAVSVSAPLVSASQQMHFATADQLYVHGASEADIQAAGKGRDVWEGYLRGNRTREEALAALGAIEHKPWFDLTFMPHPADMTPRDTSSYRLQMDEDPVRALARVKVPLLFIYGGADPWIPAAASVARLREIQKTRRDIEIRVIAGASHEMMLNAKETMAFDKKTLLASAPNAPAYFMVLASWLERHAKP